jgi:hypothetical protein
MVRNVSTWYPVVDMFTTRYYDAIVNISKEVSLAQKFLGQVKLINA